MDEIPVGKRTTRFRDWLEEDAHTEETIELTPAVERGDNTYVIVGKTTPHDNDYMYWRHAFEATDDASAIAKAREYIAALNKKEDEKDSMYDRNTMELIILNRVTGWKVIRRQVFKVVHLSSS